MDIAQLDLPALYGRWFYAVPDRLPVAAQAPADQLTGVVDEPVPASNPVNSLPQPLAFDKPAALLAVVIPEGALSDASLVELYHNILSKALNLTLDQVALAQPGAEGPWVWPSIRARVVVQFGTVPGLTTLPADAYVLPSLAELHADVALKRAAWETMKQFKPRLHE